MTEQQIKRAKKLAEILGIDDLQECDGRLLHMASDGPLSIMPVGEFDPEQDKALLWDLQHKYGVEINHFGEECFITDYSDPNDNNELANFVFKNKAEIPAALIDCVIEINGGYDD